MEEPIARAFLSCRAGSWPTGGAVGRAVECLWTGAPNLTEWVGIVRFN